MMKRNLIGVLFLSILALLLTGCPHQATVYNVENASVVVGGMGDSFTEDDVKKAIIRAGAALGWNMKVEKPGKILGTLYLRSHMAQVDIPYSERSYSIIYKTSKNLDYKDGKIHSNYNGWIQNLDRGIKNQLSLL